MPNKQYVISMATYNSWQNDSFVKAASTLSDKERQKDRGAFFGSIQNTFSHILWGDQIWLSRFIGTPPPKASIPESALLFDDWNTFTAQRADFDKTIINWTKNIDPDWFDGDLTWYSGAAECDVTKPKKLLVMHMFNHQTHHRGQIHAMLSSAGIKTDDTNMPFMQKRYEQV